MSIPVLICDDSGFACKQLAQALPGDWDAAVSFAGNGIEALAAIKAGKGDILFLDLNMPDMDGYEVLQLIHAQDLHTLVIVVSGDIQPGARERVMKLGALDFLKKPLSQGDISAILGKYGIHHATTTQTRSLAVDVDAIDGYKEIANVAMGQAADLLARLLGAFVIMPIPRVKIMQPAELSGTIDRMLNYEARAGVCQGFTGSGIAGEALLIFSHSRFSDIAELLKYTGEIDNAGQAELLTDIANIIIGASLKGIADQLDFNLSQSYPMVLGRGAETRHMLQRNAARWTPTLAIEMSCAIENREISCDLLLLFTEDSIQPLSKRISCLTG
jgi:chemotaxis protein CheY-P-specific phosphatase CheC/CheY-like chemotaxis protein